MLFLVLALCGAIFNRIRGDGIPFGKTLNDLAFGLLCGIAAGDVTAGALGVLGMAIGRAPGWGRYIGAMYGWETEDLKEWAPIDFLIKPLRGNMHYWGGAGLMLRGAFWGACLVPATGNLWCIQAGIFMAGCYQIGQLMARGHDNPQGKGWEYSELVFGGLLWGVSLGFIGMV